MPFLLQERNSEVSCVRPICQTQDDTETAEHTAMSFACAVNGKPLFNIGTFLIFFPSHAYHVSGIWMMR